MTLAKAKLFEITSWQNGAPKVKNNPRVTVQFNPASLKVSYSNQVQTNDQINSSAIQYVGRGASKLGVELIFDVSGVDATDVKDVRYMTENVAYFMTPIEDTSEGKKQYTVPGLRFQWGSFIFDGILVSMDETLDLWSEDGNPLRATVSLSMSQSGIQFQFSKNSKATPPPNKSPQSGTQRLIPATQGGTLQNMVAKAGITTDWKAVASLNEIENPRNLVAGTLVNLQGSAKASIRTGIQLWGGLNG